MKLTSIKIVDDIQVIVPASLHYLTTFVLYEQNDWFEDEIKFIRKLLQPGMKVIDIGANYGMYTLSIAKTVGENGKVWCFEPTLLTGQCLQKSISDNKFSQVVFSNKGLSNKRGTAVFYTSENSELNSLSNDIGVSTQSEEITLTTLNEACEAYAWEDIDLIKLDAEGEEVNILECGGLVLNSMSPLIMYELKHGNKVNLELVNAFKKYSYKSYYLLPGQDVLVPFNAESAIDQYVLNVFCCKDDKAEQLISSGFLVTDFSDIVDVKPGVGAEFVKSLQYSRELHETLNNLSEKDDAEFLEILDLYITSLTFSLEAKYRVSCLFSALKKMKQLIEEGESNVGRLVTFSRIAFDAGERALGVKILGDIITQYVDNLNFELNGYFLPANKAYEYIAPSGKFKEWFMSSILTQCIEKHAYSSYFSPKTSKELLLRLNRYEFIQDDMKKRLMLINKIAG